MEPLTEKDFKNDPISSDIYKDLTRKSRVTNIFTSILLVSLTLLAITTFDGVNYYDPLNSCYLYLKPNFFSENKSIFNNALKYIKANDKDLYSGICNDINEIYERPCIKASSNKPDLEILPGNGCYFKNSGVIYVNTQLTKDVSDPAKIASYIENIYNLSK